MFKPYPTYKDSDVSWLGKVPEHWGVLPNRALFEEIRERECPLEQMLSVTITQGVIHQRTLLQHSSKKDSSKEDKSAYKLVCPCDIVYNKMRAWQGAIGASDFRGIVSPAYVVVRLREANHPRYFHYLFRTPQFAKEAERWSYGITSDMWSLRPEHFKMIYGCLPSLAEQSAIVRFLDHIDRRIRRYISAKQKLIKLLEEQKQAIIHRAVTRGLDPNVRLKPSGVEWMGDMPEHWEVRRLKQAFRRIVGGSTPSSAEPKYWDGDVVWVTPSDISRAERLKSSLRRITQEGLKSCSSEFVPPGSIIVTSRAPVGNVALADVELCTNQGCKALVTTDQVVNPMFGFAVLRMLKGELQSLATGTTFTEISTTKLGIVPIPLPPILEQTAIVRYLDNTTSNITTAIDHAQREMSFLREYRTRLIADVVTGNVDVREAAERLPDEAEETEFINDTVAIAEEGEGGEDQVGDPPPEEDANG